VSFASLQVRRSIARRAGRFLPALVSLTVAAGAVGALGSLASDVGRKMRSEFRRGGANAVARGLSGAAIPAAIVAAMQREPGVERALPIDVTSESAGPHSLTSVSLDVQAARPFASSWNVSGRMPAGAGEALAGVRLARRLGWKLGQDVAVGPAGGRRVRIVGVVTTGEGEAAVSRAASRLERALRVRVDPILAVSASEGRIVERLRGLLAAIGAAVALLAALGTGTTLLASVAQRRREIALEKSLGAERGRILARFALEALALGLAGGVIGAAAGRVSAEVIERRLFGVGLSPSLFWSLVPVALAAGLALASSAPAVRRALAIEPITALREE